MAPISHHVGNVATFHGIPNTSGLTIPTPLVEMPKATAPNNQTPITPSHHQTINPYPFAMEMGQSSAGAPSTPVTPAFLPANLLMSCNLSFLYALQLQKQQLQQQQQQQQSPPAAQLLNQAPFSMNIMAQFMPGTFTAQPLLSGIPLASTMPALQATPQNLATLFQQNHQQQQQFFFHQQQNQQPQPSMSKPPVQTPPSATFLQNSPMAFFGGGPVGVMPNPTLMPNGSCVVQQVIAAPTPLQNPHGSANTFTLVANPEPSSAVAVELLAQKKDLQQPSTSHKNQQQPISPPTFRVESPDPNLPPMLEPELPCLHEEFNDLDDYCGPPELLPGRFEYGDEYGPPRLEPQVPILMEHDEPCTSSKLLTIPSKPISPPALVSPLMKREENLPRQNPSRLIVSPPSKANEDGQNQPLDLKLKSPTLPPPPPLQQQQPLTSIFNFSSPPTSHSITATSSTFSLTDENRKRSSSTDSSDIMLKMPKLIPMLHEEQADVEAKVEEKPLKAEDEPTFLVMVCENKEEFESSASSALYSDQPTASSTDDSLEPQTFEPIRSASVQQQQDDAKQEEHLHEEVASPFVEHQREATLEPQPQSSELMISVESHHDTSATSSGVSSADSSLLAEEPIVIRFKRPTIEEPSRDEHDDTVDEDELSEEDEEESPSPSPLLSVQNTKMRPQPNKKQSSKKQSSKRRSKTTSKSRRSSKKSRQLAKALQKPVKFQSNWRPVDEGQILDFRINHVLHRHRCYNAIRHYREYDEVVRVRDCIKVRSSEGLENIGKIIRIYLDESNGSICIQVLWYYTEAQAAKDIVLHERELLASKHCDVICADTIEERAFVLTYSEYCRFVAETRIDELPPTQRPLESRELISRGDENYGRRLRLPHEDSPIDLVYWASRIYSIRTRKICVSAMSSSRRGSGGSSGNRRKARQR